jgi:hypothetical protein
MASLVRRQAGLVAALWLSFMLAGRTRLLQDPGTFWHIAAGERMLESGRVLEADPFAAESFGRPWIAMQWLAELGMAMLYRLGELDALVACAAALLALLHAFVLCQLRKQGARVGLALTLTGLALAAGAHHFLARPHLVTMLGVAFTQAALLAWEEAAPQRERNLLLLVPGFVLWTNLHGGVAGGLVMVFAVAAGWALLSAVRLSAVLLTRRDALVVAATVLGCGFAPFVNPYGAALPRTWLQLSGSSLLPKLIEEHAPLSGSSPGAVVLIVLAALYVGALAGVPLRGQRATFAVPLFWLLLSVRSARHVPLFALVAVLTLPRVLRACRWLPEALGARSRSLFSLGLPRLVAEPAAGLALGVVAVLWLAFGAQASGARVAVLGRGWATPAPRVAPLELLPALHAAAAARPEGSGILNEMDHGGFLILHVPRLRVFIDDRWEVHGDQAFARYVHDSERDPRGLDLWAEALDIDLALAPAGSPLDTYLNASARWRRLAHAPTASLYERNESVLAHARTPVNQRFRRPAVPESGGLVEARANECMVKASRPRQSVPCSEFQWSSAAAGFSHRASPPPMPSWSTPSTASCVRTTRSTPPTSPPAHASRWASRATTSSSRPPASKTATSSTRAASATRPSWRRACASARTTSRASWPRWAWPRRARRSSAPARSPQT